MKPNSSGIFDDLPSRSHKKVVKALLAQGYSVDRISKATGIAEAEVKKIVRELT